MTDPQRNTTADRVEQLFRTGRPQEAIELCRRVCETSGATSDDWFLYGCVSADTGDSATALMALGRAVELNPGQVEAQFGLGKLLATLGEHAAAIDRLQQAAALQPDNADIWLTLGIAHGLAKQLTRAEECCHRSLALQPGSAPAHFNLANALQAQGRFAEAEAGYEAALKIEPELVRAWSMLAQARIGQRKFAEAEAAAMRAIALEPRTGEAHFTLAGLLEGRDEIQQARRHYAQAADLLPGFPEAHLRLGMVLDRLGEPAAAVESYRRVLDLRQDLPGVHYLMGESFRVQRLFGKAEAAYRRTIALDNDHLQAHYRLAFGLQAAGHHEEAAKHFEEILRINPHDDQARHLLAAQRGDTPSTAPAAYVASLFDEAADTFDEKLVGTLQYRTPQLLRELMRQHVAPAGKSQDIIDLGCGTGLCAPLFRDIAHFMQGVDLSPRMIEKAKQGNLYDALEVGDITASLRSKAAAWDLAIAADVFVYLGDLREVFAACATALRPGGILAFSVETGDDNGTFVLRQTGRYAHSDNYIRALAADAGFTEVGSHAAVLRRESGRDVQGRLYLLRRPLILAESVYRVKYSFD
ncbi:methyltransferase [Sulfuricaulis limicola]|uniref:Methyltransferase n=2 Tax=Sulfuricaulis limicola TaxID=1620215 RepID=A0A1B4XGD9_9GAMM|nr:methyltransferase [Sulfuricaulis limicola]